MREKPTRLRGALGLIPRRTPDIPDSGVTSGDQARINSFSYLRISRPYCTVLPSEVTTPSAQALMALFTTDLCFKISSPRGTSDSPKLPAPPICSFVPTFRGIPGSRKVASQVSSSTSTSGKAALPW